VLATRPRPAPAMGNFFSDLGHAVTGVAKAVASVPKTVANDAASVAKTVVNAPINLVKASGAAIGTVTTDIFKGTTGLVGTAFGGTAQLVTAAGGAAGNVIHAQGQAIGDAFGGAGAGVGSVISSLKPAPQPSLALPGVAGLPGGELGGIPTPLLLGGLAAAAILILALSGKKTPAASAPAYMPMPWTMMPMGHP